LIIGRERREDDRTIGRAFDDAVTAALLSTAPRQSATPMVRSVTVCRPLVACTVTL
jgi:hypothetical protein